ncbi:geranylgeranyl transferase type-2 subunit alpha [Microplitis mediator]|uniref:geranylgeranyl transferase type-2 subunit alpha n=1 Tax=Microplitis mediator TaxID=375433 RepID=UPI002556F5C7|nr:geranylgeranyl transferase type-2 subunit alpha [Microplitis mediator]XP_057328589.1 geranylgeranyl transferase type-2 subunit alpha [Microplitis mediator]XP_057328590.1 geranylgeranyl transferase type-2 subunit alpha [Microplitis mediator]
MHGRLKIRSSAEQEARKKKEKQMKVVKYKEVMNLIFQKRDDNLYDDELLMLTERILSEIPDLSSVWNIRREAFKKREWCQEEYIELLNKELILTENCLHKNPKSYNLWHQRHWVIHRLPEAKWKSELELCNKCLNLDDRNFHCWDYRQQLVKNAGVPNQNEFEFSELKIMGNLSNYSSWHYRSKIISNAFSDETENLSICHEKYNKELDLVINAIFTDPNDSSAWLYQRWLLEYNMFKANDIWQIKVTENSATIIFHGNTEIKPDELILTRKYSRLDSHIDHTSTWHSYNNKVRSKQWHSNLPVIANGVDRQFLSISVKHNNKSYDLHKSKNCNVWYYKSSIKRTNTHRTQLIEQFINIEKLLEMEPNNKWALLTMILLMKNLDLIKYYNEILKNLSTLMKIDNLHTEYYADIRSKYLLDYKLHTFGENEEDFDTWSITDLSNLQLTILYNEHGLSFVEQLNISGNQLNHSLHRLAVLQNCRKLALCNNNLANLKNFPYLSSLKYLSLRKNKLTNIEDILNLLKQHKLTELDIRDNLLGGNINEITSKILTISPNLTLKVNE